MSVYTRLCITTKQTTLLPPYCFYGELMSYIMKRHSALQWTTGPVILLFKRFKAFWKNILICNFNPGIENQSVAAAVLDFTADVIDFAFRQLEPTHQREDYRELLDLTPMFLGRVPPRTWCHSQSTVHVKIDTCICFENRPVQRCWI